MHVVTSQTSLDWRLVLCFSSGFSMSACDLRTAFRWSGEECAFGNNLVLRYETCFAEYMPCVFQTLFLSRLESSRISFAQRSSGWGFCDSIHQFVVVPSCNINLQKDPSHVFFIKGSLPLVFLSGTSPGMKERDQEAGESALGLNASNPIKGMFNFCK